MPGTLRAIPSQVSVLDRLGRPHGPSRGPGSPSATRLRVRPTPPSTMHQGESAMRANPEISRTARRRNRTDKAARLGARASRRLQFEPLEDRTMLAISVGLTNGPPAWTSLGPDELQGGSVTGMT